MRGCSRLQVDLVRVLCTAVLLFAPGEGRPQQEEDAWLAVINGHNSGQQPPPGYRQQQQLEERVDVSPQEQTEVRQNFRPPPAQAQPAGRPVPVVRRPPQPGPGARPFPAGPPPPPLRRGPPPPRPLPAKKEGPGILGTISEGIGNILKPVSCAATDIITDNQLNDEKFIRSQMNCARGTGPCDQIGKQIKILAPEVLAGRCPHPCNECIKKQIRKVMAQLSQRYPREFQEMMGQLRRLKG